MGDFGSELDKWTIVHRLETPVVATAPERKKFTDKEHADFVDNKRRKRMNRVDNLPPELRKIVHSYGLSVVDVCLTFGVKNPRHIRHLVETILDELSPTRGSYSQQGVRTDLKREGR